MRPRTACIRPTRWSSTARLHYVSRRIVIEWRNAAVRQPPNKNCHHTRALWRPVSAQDFCAVGRPVSLFACSSTTLMSRGKLRWRWGVTWVTAVTRLLSPTAGASASMLLLLLLLLRHVIDVNLPQRNLLNNVMCFRDVAKRRLLFSSRNNALFVWIKSAVLVNFTWF